MADIQNKQTDRADPILEFIRRRFPDEAEWTGANGYYFAAILNTAFVGEIDYDLVDGEFLFFDYSSTQYYTWNGVKEYSYERRSDIVSFENYSIKDMRHYCRIYEQCCA